MSSGSHTKRAKPGQVLASGPVKRLHIDQSAVKAGDECCVLIQHIDGPWRCQQVAINGPSVLKSDFADPLPCGARIWIETHASVGILI